MNATEFIAAFTALFNEHSVVPTTIDYNNDTYTLMYDNRVGIADTLIESTNYAYVCYCNDTTAFIITEASVGDEKLTLIEYDLPTSFEKQMIGKATETIIIGLNGGDAIPGEVDLAREDSVLYVKSFDIVKSDGGDRVAFIMNDKQYTADIKHTNTFVTPDSGVEYAPVIALDARTAGTDAAATDVELRADGALTSHFNPGMHLIKEWDVAIDVSMDPVKPLNVKIHEAIVSHHSALICRITDVTETTAEVDTDGTE